MKESLNQVVYSKNAVEFVTVANEYCKFVEGCDEHSQKDFVKLALKLLPLLYLKGSILVESMVEEVEEHDDQMDFGTEIFVSEIEYYAIENSIKSKIGDYNEYPEIFEAQNIETNEISLCFISEDLTDIYQDLKNFTQNYRNGVEEVMADSLYEVNNQFISYWGQRLVNSMRALHNLLFNADLSDELENQQSEIEEDEDLDDLLPPKASAAWLNDRFEENTNNPFAI